MVYRPQFVYRLSDPPCQDYRTSFSFDYSNVPILASPIPTTFNQNFRIPLVIDKDAPFLLRGIRISPTLLYVGLVDPSNNPLVDNGQNAGGLGPGLPVNIWGGAAGFGVCPQDSDDWGVYCQPASRFGLYIANNTGGSLAAPVITLDGVKRYRKGACR